MGADGGEDRFRFRHPVEVRFRDLDPMGHAHHSLPLMYFEEARAAYWRDVAGRADPDEIDYIMGRVTLEYHDRIYYPATLEAGVRVAELGDRSFTMEYSLCAEDGRLLASGSSAQVMFDYEAGRTRPIPADVRQRVEAFEARSG